MSDRIKYARMLRDSMTFAERLLWSRLRRRKLQGFRFRRQVPIGNYIADFVCIEMGLILEIDGSQHFEQVEYDDDRTKYLNSLGYEVVRYWNNDVLRDIDVVMADILCHLQRRIKG